MRILVVGPGVIGSVYGAKLAQAGHDVVLLARGHRLAELPTHGLQVEDAQTGRRDTLRLPTVAAVEDGMACDLVLVAVRRDQLASTSQLLAGMTGSADVLFLGNAVGCVAELRTVLGDRALFGFPAAGGVRDGAVTRYVLIRQQNTMLADPRAARSPRIRRLAALFATAGFPCTISADAEGWLLAHTAFVVPIGYALYRVGVDPARLAADPSTLRLMVRATRQAFQALRTAGNAEIPANLRVLYLHMPTGFAVRYWHRVFASPRGELWFAAHTRAARAEMVVLAAELRTTIAAIGRPVPDVDLLLSAR